MPFDLLASLEPPSYADSTAGPSLKPKDTATSNGLHPRVAVVLGISTRWHVPLLICRALSTAPAAWWGLRCAFTFLGELLLSDAVSLESRETWTVEKRFRVTEVFLAILWVWRSILCCVESSDLIQYNSAQHPPIFRTFSRIV